MRDESHHHAVSGNRLTRRILLPLVAPVALTLLACAGSGSPTGSGTRVEVVSGQGQRGLAGEPLLDRIGVRVVDGEGRPLTGRRVDFAVEAGGGVASPGSATTDAAGIARTTWILGDGPLRTRLLRASVAGGPEVTVESTAIGPDEADVIVLLGADGPIRGVAVVRESGPGEPLEVVQDRVVADTIVPVVPMDRGTTGIAAFPSANAVEWATATWTAGIDTVRIALRPRVPLVVRISVAEGPFDLRRRVVEEHVTAFRRILEEQGAGIVLGEVEIVDRTDTMGGSDVGDPDPCSFSSIPMDRLHVYYVRTVGGRSPRGVSCPPRLAFVAADPGELPNLLAHEVGHLLGLPHGGQGVMNASAPGTTLSDGEVFQAHFKRTSAVNLVFGWNPPEVLRHCGIPTRPTCLPLDYELR